MLWQCCQQITGTLDMSISVRPLRQISESFLLIKIEQFVDLVNSEVSFRKISNNELLMVLTFNLNECLALYEPNTFDYSEHINAFWYGCDQLGWLDCGYYNRLRLSEAEIECLINHIRQYSQQKEFKRKVSDRCYQTKQNRQSLENHIRQQQEKYSRLLVVRVDFGYAKEKQNFIKITDVYTHLDMMKCERDGNPLFEHLVSSGWCVEQGKEKGYHIHAFYCFKGSEHQQDWYLAQEIGRLWKAIAADFGGGYHNCNTPESKAIYQRAKRAGVGMIHRHDDLACENMIHALGYLAKPEKDDQYLRMKPRGRRAFGKTQ